MKQATLKRIIYVFCAVAYTGIGLLSVFGLLILPIATPVINGHRGNQFYQLALIMALMAVISLAPGVLLFVVAVAHTRLLSSPQRSKYLFGATGVALAVALLADLLNTVIGGSTLSSVSFGFSFTPLSKEHTLFNAPLLGFSLVALIAVVHDVAVCHKRSQAASSIF
jgi:hypothetical protein